MSVQSASRKIQDATPWYAQRWPWLLMLGPALVIVAGTWTFWLAYSRPDALVVDDYYMQGKAINLDLRRDRNASVLELSATLRYDPAAGRIVATMQSHGSPMTSPVRLRLVHSTLPEKDIVLDLLPDAQGGMSVALPMLEQAKWKVLLENTARDWRLAGVWPWPSQTGIRLQADRVRLEGSAPPGTLPRQP